MSEKIVYLPAHQLVKLIKSGELTIPEVVEAFLKQIERYNPQINAIFNMRRRDDIMKEAEEKSKLRKDAPLGPLHGLPMTVKDNFWVKGLKVSNGHPLYRNFVANQDALLIQKLKNAGAIIIGKTNVPLFSIDWQATNFWNGTTNNPYDLNRVPGGSSGGAAAAVAAGLSPVELGGDQGGSIRVPAHFCGICGIRPTENALSNRGHIRFPNKPQGQRQVTVAGPLAKNVEDLIMMMDVLWNHDTHPLAEVPPVAFKSTSWNRSSLNIAVSESMNKVPIDHEYLEIFRGFISKLAEKEHTISKDEPSYDEDKAYHTCGKITGYEFEINMPKLPLASTLMYCFIRGKYKDHAWAKGIYDGIGISAREYTKTLDYKDHFANTYHKFLHQYDLWITPVAAIEAFEHQKAGKSFTVNKQKVPYTKAIASYNFTSALSGHPIVVIPIGLKKNGMPVGVQIHAKKWADHKLLEIAKHFSQLTDKFTIPELVTTGSS
ncbi:MAG: amidase [Cyclobacteriaceae bacterium]